FVLRAQRPTSTLFPYTTLFRSCRVELVGRGIGQSAGKSDGLGSDDGCLKDFLLFFRHHGDLDWRFIVCRFGRTNSTGGIATQDESFNRSSQAEVRNSGGYVLLAH